MKHKILLLPFLALLTGCNAASEKLEELAGVRRPSVNAIKEPVYCYRTWADATCYDHEIPGQKARLIGHFEPPPGVMPVAKVDTAIIAPAPVEVEPLLEKKKPVKKKSKKKLKKKKAKKKAS